MTPITAMPKAESGWLLLQKPLQLARGLTGMLMQPQAGAWPPGIVLQSKESICQHPSCSKMLPSLFVCWICLCLTACVLNAAGNCPVPEKHWEQIPTLNITELLLHMGNSFPLIPPKPGETKSPPAHTGVTGAVLAGATHGCYEPCG